MRINLKNSVCTKCLFVVPKLLRRQVGKIKVTRIEVKLFLFCSHYVLIEKNISYLLLLILDYLKPVFQNNLQNSVYWEHLRSQAFQT